MSKSPTEVSFFGMNINKVMYQPQNDPETKLWRAVLGQALYDAFGPERYDTTPKERREALEFLKDFENDSFKELCENAGFDPEYIKRKVRKKFAERFIYAINKFSTKVNKGENYAK